MSTTIKIVREESAILELANEWDETVPTSFAATLSQSAWYFAWHDVFAPKTRIIVTAREGNRLVGILPLSKIRTDLRGLYFPQVTTFTGGDYQLPVIASDAGVDVLPKMVDAAVEYFGKRIVYWWANLPTSEPSAQLLATHIKSKGMTVTEEYHLAPRLELSGMEYAQIESKWSPSHRTDVRRQTKRLAAIGNTSLWEPKDLSSARTLLEEFFFVHDEKWLSQGQPGRFQDLKQRAHFLAIVNRLWGRGLYLSVLRCGDVNVSYGLGFLSDGWIQWYRPTYRRQYQNVSPGKVHISFLVKEACRRGWKGIDFLQGAEGYKLQWANSKMCTVDYYATFHSLSPSYQWFTRGKPYMRNRAGALYARTKARLQKLKIGRQGREGA